MDGLPCTRCVLQFDSQGEGGAKLGLTFMLALAAKYDTTSCPMMSWDFMSSTCTRARKRSERDESPSSARNEQTGT